VAVGMICDNGDWASRGKGNFDVSIWTGSPLPDSGELLFFNMLPPTTEKPGFQEETGLKGRKRALIIF
jgi:hypothetical protein